MLESRHRDSFRFAPAEPVADGIARVGCSQLDLTIELLRQSAPESYNDGEAVHEARKALKRLRALLRVSRRVIGDERYRDESRTLRDAGRTLSGTRDAQVLLETLDGLTERYEETLQAGTWSGLRASLLDAAQRAGVVDPGEAVSLVGVLSDTRARIITWRLASMGAPESLASGFEGVYRRGRRAYVAARKSPSSESLHELRKRAKDLWHSAQLFEPAAPDQMRELSRSAHRLSDLLGEHHDFAILREHARRHSDLLSPAESELLLALIRSRQEALRSDALSRASELYGTKPRKLPALVALAGLGHA